MRIVAGATPTQWGAGEVKDKAIADHSEERSDSIRSPPGRNYGRANAYFNKGDLKEAIADYSDARSD